MNPDFAKNIFELTDAATSIVVTSHTSPDDDSIASVLSAYRLLTAKYPSKKIRIVYSAKAIEKYKSFASFDRIEFVEEIVDHLDDCNLLIMLDGNQLGRFSRKLDLGIYKNKTICIDHHASAPSQFTLSYIYPQASATVEIIYDLFFKGQKLDKQTAEILLLGLLGDTGDFTYLTPKNTNVFDMAKVLLTVADCEIQEFKSRYATISPKMFSIVQEFVKNTQFCEIAGWPKFMYSYINREFADGNKLSDNEISEAGSTYVTNYLRAITDYTWGFVVTPKSDGSCNLSSRSMPKSVNVRILAEQVTSGGGHDHAAGGKFKSIDGSLIQSENCVEKIKQWMMTNSPVLS